MESEYEKIEQNIIETQEEVKEFYSLPIDFTYEVEVFAGIDYGQNVIHNIIVEAEGENDLGVDGQTTVTKETLETAKANVIKAHELIIKDADAAIANPTTSEEVKEKCIKFKKDITHKMVEKSAQHSNFCHFNLLHHRVRNTEVITYKKLDNVKMNCEQSLNRINRQMKKCKKPKQMESKGEYISGLLIASENELRDTFNKWSNADDSLYDETLKTTKRKNCLKNNSDNLRKDYMECNKFGRELKSYWETEAANGNVEAAAELSTVNELFESEEIQNGWANCVGEMDNLVELVTPQYRAD